MAATLAAEGMVYCLKQVNGSADMGLFKGDKTPAAIDVWDDYEGNSAVEANYTGYANQLLAFGNAYWDNPKAKSPAEAIDFVATGSAVTNTIYGYYGSITGSPAVFAGRLSSSTNMNQSGDRIVLTLTLTLEDGGA